jgi:hypothetical protein
VSDASQLANLLNFFLGAVDRLEDKLIALGDRITGAPSEDAAAMQIMIRV